MPAGRPGKYTEARGEELIGWMAEGYSLTAAAGKMGIHRDTVYQWAEEKPEFSDALKRGRALAAAWWERMARRAAENNEGSASVIIFALKNRVSDEWRDKVEQDHRSPDGSMSGPTKIQIVPGGEPSGDHDGGSGE